MDFDEGESIGNGSEPIGYSFGKDQSVQVVIRIRPLSSTEIFLHGNTKCVRETSCQTITWIGPTEKRFTFDIVADEYVSQEKLFNVAGVPMVENCVAGYNSCMFAYGQTGSGKTHTMIGDIEGGACTHSVNRGMAPRVFEHMFARIQKEKKDRSEEKILFTCKCSFLEIYNEQIFDLLDPSSVNLQIRVDAKKGVHVENLTEEEVSSARDVMQKLIQGAANRKVAATKMNRASSRSHNVFTCVIESKWEGHGVTYHRFARLNLVDLAGSERQKSSGAEGDRLKEATNINKSLSTLGLVIMNLSSSNKKPRHVPYRESKLTFLLQDSLGGNSKTIIIANISPSNCFVSETLSTLQFAQRAKFIRNNAVMNEDSVGDALAMHSQIRQLKDEIKRLEAINSGKVLVETQLLQEKGELLKEIEDLRNKVDHNAEGARFSMENFQLKELIRLRAAFVDDGEREMLNQHEMVLLDKSSEALDWKPMHENDTSVAQMDEDAYGKPKMVNGKKRPHNQLDNGKRKRQKRYHSHDDSSGTPIVIETLYRILCPVKIISNVLGERGEIVKAIRDETRAKIMVADAIPRAEERVVIIFNYLSKQSGKVDVDEELENDNIAGNESDELQPQCPAQDALLKVHDMVAVYAYPNGGVVHTKTDTDVTVTARILVPSNQVGCLLGKGGTVINKLRSDYTGANIRVLTFDHLPPCAMNNDELVQISGTRTVVKKALYDISTRLHRNLHKENPPIDDILNDSIQGLFQPTASMPPPQPIWSSQHDDFYSTPHAPWVGGYRSETLVYGPSSHNSRHSENDGDTPEEFSMRILCPTGKIGRVIGTAGANIRQLEHDTLARIQVEDTPREAAERIISVTSREGHWHQISPTIEAILQLQIRSSADAEDGTITTRLLVPSSKVGCLLGQCGNIIREMRRRTGAYINVYSKEEKPYYASENEELVQISGDREVARNALMEIASKLRTWATKFY